VDTTGNVYVTGTTGSADFPTVNAFQPALASGGSNAFVAKLNSTGSALVYSTYLGGSGGTDFGLGIAVSSAGNAFVTGWTNSADFPTVNPLQPTYGGGQDAFVAKFNATGSGLLYSTYIGGSKDDVGLGIAVDSSGHAYVTGYTNSTNFPIMNAFQSALAGPQDAFVAQLNHKGSAFVYSTYLGGRGGDNGSGIALDRAGNAYVSGTTTSADFPTVNPLQPSYGGGSDDAFVAKVSRHGAR
jgi:Beta-propeller repeat